MDKTILMIGAFDAKGAEFAFVRDQILAQRCNVLAMDFGIFEPNAPFAVDIPSSELAAAGGTTIDELRSSKDRGLAMKTMAAGAPFVVRRLYDEERIDGIIGMGGSGGTTVSTAAMRALPVGFPKVCVSTLVAGDVAPYVGSKDITMISSIVDIAGLNRISRLILARAAGAVCGMAKSVVPEAPMETPIIAATMFGNTTQCVDRCRAALTDAGYEILVFHATGAGGRTMESLVHEGLIDGVLDITTTEWADEICGGVLSAGPERLSAPGEMGIPHLVVPGCIDMANFGGIDSVPDRYRKAHRKLYPWTPTVTLMRTDVAENEAMGRVFAEKLNAAKGPVAVLLPLRGVSLLDGDGQEFCDRAADFAMFDTLKQLLRKDIPVVALDCNINDPEFGEKAVEMMLDMMEPKHTGG